MNGVGWYYGPVESSWGDLKARLERLRPGLDELKYPTFSLDPADAAAEWQTLFGMEMAAKETLEDFIIALARCLHDRTTEGLGAEHAYFLWQRAEMVLPVVEAMTTNCEQAWKPARLFHIQRADWLLEQQTLWALMAYWEEFGRKRWQMAMMRQIGMAWEKWRKDG